MRKQNFIAKILCNVAGDKYTIESMENSLRDTLREAQKNVVQLDIHSDNWILLSDLHKGAKNGADDFRLCEWAYILALNHYLEAGYSLCVMGDAEELWEELPRTVIQKNSASFTAEKRFHEAGRYRRLWGNHDEIWSDPNQVRALLQPLYGSNPLEVPEAILLEVRDGSDMLGRVLLVHGHQGSHFEGNSPELAKWVVRNIWRPIQARAGFSCNTPATDWKLRHDRDKVIYHWAANQPGLVVIAGHTHAPVFGSYSHRARLIAEIADIRAKLDTLPEDRRAEGLKRIEKMTVDLHNIESSLSESEQQEPQPIEDLLPCYFNTGCCAFSDGDITGIEIADGEIRLVRWPDDDGSPRGKVLQSSSLREIFQDIQQ